MGWGVGGEDVWVLIVIEEMKGFQNKEEPQTKTQSGWVGVVHGVEAP